MMMMMVMVIKKNDTRMKGNDDGYNSNTNEGKNREIA